LTIAIPFVIVVSQLVTVLCAGVPVIHGFLLTCRIIPGITSIHSCITSQQVIAELSIAIVLTRLISSATGPTDIQIIKGGITTVVHGEHTPCTCFSTISGLPISIR